MTVGELVEELRNVDQSLHVVTANDFQGIMLVPSYLLRGNDREFRTVPTRQG